LNAVPAVTQSVAREWQLELGEVFGNGTNGLVLAVTRSDGSPAVLKMPFVYDQNRHEADALRHYRGEGAVQLEAFDEATGALLLERARPGTALADHADRLAMAAIGCNLLRRLWRDVVNPHPFRSVSDLAAGWMIRIPEDFERHGQQIAKGLVPEALSSLRSLVASIGHQTLVNGDFHFGNVLASEREPWLLIDPKPLVGDRAFDVAQLVIQCLGDERRLTRARDLFFRLSRELDVECHRVASWIFVMAAKNVLSSLEAGADPNPQLELARTFRALL
jgi:streptomycin 6-kinase